MKTVLPSIEKNLRGDQEKILHGKIKTILKQENHTSHDILNLRDYLQGMMDEISKPNNQAVTNTYLKMTRSLSQEIGQLLYGENKTMLDNGPREVADMLMNIKGHLQNTIFSNQITPEKEYYFHNLIHTLTVTKFALSQALLLGGQELDTLSHPDMIDSLDREIYSQKHRELENLKKHLGIAALFHDVGYMRGKYKGNEADGVDIMKAKLKELNISLVSQSDKKRQLKKGPITQEWLDAEEERHLDQIAKYIMITDRQFAEGGSQVSDGTIFPGEPGVFYRKIKNDHNKATLDTDHPLSLGEKIMLDVDVSNMWRDNFIDATVRLYMEECAKAKEQAVDPTIEGFIAFCEGAKKFFYPHVNFKNMRDGTLTGMDEEFAKNLATLQKMITLLKSI